MQKIKPCLWFDTNAEEAVNHYTSIFPNSRIVALSRYGEGAPLPKGTVLVITFQLEGQDFMALNGGPAHARFTEAISLAVDCSTQAELDALWSKLSEGGAPGPCGWLKDKFGLSWQIVPKQLAQMIQDPDVTKVARVMKALMAMGKLDIAELQRAYDGR